jgi:hypothetical protein
MPDCMQATSGRLAAAATEPVTVVAARRAAAIERVMVRFMEMILTFTVGWSVGALRRR